MMGEEIQLPAGAYGICGPAFPGTKLYGDIPCAKPQGEIDYSLKPRGLQEDMEIPDRIIFMAEPAKPQSLFRGAEGFVDHADVSLWPNLYHVY
jgi:hypothetical protein